MLDHDEERRLAEIEARLRLDAPDLCDLLEGPIGPVDAIDLAGPVESVDPIESLEWVGPAGSAESNGSVGSDGSAESSGVGCLRRPLVRSVLAVVVAVALTAAVTLTVGPDLGGLVGVLALTAAAMYAYQSLRGCPGMRRHRGRGPSPEG